ncbi:hypothetical protein B4Q13_16795 [Lacticaseibacillus rhamnosus]
MLDYTEGNQVRAAGILGIKIPYTEDEINRACYQAAEVQNIKDGYVRPVAFRGAATRPPGPAPHAGVHVAVAVWRWPSYFDPKEKLKGIRRDISDWRRPAPDTAWVVTNFLVGFISR